MWTPKFTRLWSSEAVSLVGSQLTTFALPIIALQLLSATAGEVALVNTAAGLGTLSFAMLFAHWTDSPYRRNLMIGLNLTRMGVVVALAGCVALSTLTLWGLAVSALLLAGVTATYDSIFAAVMPLSVQRESLTRANAWVGGMRSAANIGAGGAAGALLQFFGPVALLVADSVTYLFAALGVSGVRVAAPPEKPTGIRLYFISISSGFRFLWNDAILRTVTVSIAHFNFFTTGVQALYVTYLLRTVGLSPTELGISAACGGVVGMLGVLAGPRLLNRVRLAPLLSLTLALPSITVVAVLQMGHLGTAQSIVLLAVSLGLWSVSVLVNVTATESLKQALVPNALLGRYTSASRVITWGMDPLGAAFAGALTLFLSITASLTVLAVGVATSFLWIALNRHTRTLPKFDQVVPHAIDDQLETVTKEE